MERISPAHQWRAANTISAGRSSRQRHCLGLRRANRTCAIWAMRQTAKLSAVRSQRLCLRPPYVPFSWTAIVGNRTGSEVLKSPPRPHSSVPRRGTANPTSQSYGRVTAFLRPRSAYRAFAVEKGRPQHPSAEMSGPGSALVFGRPFGDERRQHHRSTPTT
jgi:hypothetical protein